MTDIIPEVLKDERLRFVKVWSPKARKEEIKLQSLLTSCKPEETKELIGLE